MSNKSDKPNPEQNAASIETIAGQLVAMQMLLETVIIDGVRSGALSSDLFINAVGQGLEVFPKNKNLSQNELVGAYNFLRNRESQRLFGWEFTYVKAQVDAGTYIGDRSKAEENLKEIQTLYPLKLSEATPKKTGN